MACNCNEEGKVINIGMGCCQPIVANADNYYTKSEIDEKIDDIVISGGGITSGEVQTMIDSSIADKADKSEIPTVPNNVSAFVNDVPYLTEHQSLTNYATKQWVEDKHYITGVDLSDYALKEEIPDISGYATEQWVNDQGFLKTHQSLEGYATENWVQSQGYLTQHQDLSDYALKSEIPDISGLASETYVSNYTYDKATIDQKIGEGSIFDPTQYYNKAQTNELLGNKLDASAYTPCDLSNYYTKDETNNQISTATADMATMTWVRQQGYLTEHQSLSGYATEQWVQNQGYLTEHQSLSAYSTTQEVANMINQSVSGKQDSLTAGTGIDITNNVISVTGGSQPVDAYTKAESDAKFATITNFNTHSGNTSIHVTASEKLTWNAKADASSVYNKTEIDNKLSVKPNVWCGDESEWSQISGSTESGTIYLVY